MYEIFMFTKWGHVLKIVEIHWASEGFMTHFLCKWFWRVNSAVQCSSHGYFYLLIQWFWDSTQSYGPRNHFVQSSPLVTWRFEILRGEGTCSAKHRVETGLKARFPNSSSQTLCTPQLHPYTTAALPDPPWLLGRRMLHCLQFPLNISVEQGKYHKVRGIFLLRVLLYLRCTKVPDT